jgi:hypothetical protein
MVAWVRCAMKCRKCTPGADLGADLGIRRGSCLWIVCGDNLPPVSIWRIVWPASNRCAKQSEDWVVQLVNYALGTLQTFLNAPLYSWQAHLSKRSHRLWIHFNYIYELEWVLVIVLLWTATPDHLVVALVALWRASEILTWYIKLMFDKGHRKLLEVERNLLFLVIDVLIFVTLLALVLTDGTLTVLSFDKWADAFSAFTLNGVPIDYEEPWAAIVAVLGAVGGFTLIGAGLAMLVGLIGQRIQYGPGTGYTGPTRPPPPWQR